MKELRASLRRLLRPALDSVPEGWLFAYSGQAALIVDAATSTIVEANPAATDLLGALRTELLGTTFVEAFSSASAPRLQQALAAAQATGRCDEVAAATRGGRTPLRLALSLVRREGETFVLVHLSPQSGLRPRTLGSDDPGAMFEMLEDTAEGFVVTDLQLRIAYANRSFVRCVGVDSAAALDGQSVVRWLSLSERDLKYLADHLARRAASVVLRSGLQRADGSTREVDLWAVPVPDGPFPCWGFRVRLVERAAPPSTDAV
jgi:PAS domain S-box-containing protein